MRTRKRMHPYVTRDLEHRAVAHCAAKGITVSAFVEGALEARLDGEAKDNEVIKRDLARLGRGSMRHERELAVLTESLGVFVKMWFAFQPEMPEADKPAAERLSDRRYRDFVNYVSEQLARVPGWRRTSPRIRHRWRRLVSARRRRRRHPQEIGIRRDER